MSAVWDGQDTTYMMGGKIARIWGELTSILPLALAYTCSVWVGGAPYIIEGQPVSPNVHDVMVVRLTPNGQGDV